MNDVVVVKAAHDLHDGVALADVGQELVAQALARGRALDQAGNVDKLDRRRHGGAGLGQAAQLVEPRVGHGDDADVGLDRAKGKVGGGSLAVFTDGVEQGGLKER